jgi:deoxyadenosine/deoxycytidine kinase
VLPRSIDSLLVVAGAHATGKSTIIEGLRAGSVRVPLTVTSFEDWKQRKSGRMHAEEKPRLRKLILHVNNFGRGRPDFSEVEEILTASKETRCLTLYARPEVLVKRISERERILRPEGGLDSLSSLYRDVAGLAERYEDWFALLNRFPIIEHLLVDTSEPTNVYHPVEHWQAAIKPSWLAQSSS